MRSARIQGQATDRIAEAKVAVVAGATEGLMGVPSGFASTFDTTPATSSSRNHRGPAAVVTPQDAHRQRVVDGVRRQPGTRADEKVGVAPRRPEPRVVRRIVALDEFFAFALALAFSFADAFADALSTACTVVSGDGHTHDGKGKTEQRTQAR
jgi:hypothetical protein